MATPSALPQGSFVAVWAGENPVTHAALLDRLDEAGIPYIDRSVADDPAIAGPDPLPITPKPRFGFEIAVLSKDVDAAKALIDPLLELELQPLAELPADEHVHADRGGDDESSARAQVATCVVWSGNDPKTARFIADALRENAILARTEACAGKFTLLVPPAREARAREIVSEITQGTPPD